MPGVTPHFSRSSAVISLCDVSIGIVTVDSTPPRLIAGVMSFKLSRELAHGNISVQLERQHPTEAIHLLGGNLVTRMGGESRVKNAGDGIVSIEELCAGHGVLVLTLHAYVQRLEAAVQQMARDGVEWSVGGETFKNYQAVRSTHLRSPDLILQIAALLLCEGHGVGFSSTTSTRVDSALRFAVPETAERR